MEQTQDTRTARGTPMLKQGWYVAAWSEELSDQPLARTLLGEPVVLYRRADGAAVALEDRCPHRNLPLSVGRVTGDRIECGYHGLVFDDAGLCRHVPGQDEVPGWACVRTYEVAEEHGWVLVWMGDPEKADRESVPRFQTRLSDPEWLTYSGHITAKCGYRLILDNLLDLSHLAYVHGSTTGNRAMAENAAIATDIDGDCVRVTRWMADIPPAKAFAEYAGYNGNIDRWQGSEFMPPSYIYVNSGTDDAGNGPPPGEWMSSQGRWGFVVYHALTPETDVTTHQFWAVSLPDKWVDPKRRDVFERQMREIPLEDLRVYEAQQRAIELDPDAQGDTNPRGTIGADEGLLAMRRILRRLQGEEEKRHHDANTGA